MAVAQCVRQFGNPMQSLIDIGPDHALLPQYLLQNNLVRWITAVEKHRAPFERAQRALADFDNCTVSLGDGLGGLTQQADVLTASGMGAIKITNILSANANRVPKLCILQSNDSPAPIRQWARLSGFHLIEERMVQEKWRVAILCFEKRAGEDSIYSPFSSVDEMAAADFFGPRLLQSNCQLLQMEIAHQAAIADSLPESSKGRVDLTRLVETALKITNR